MRDMTTITVIDSAEIAKILGVTRDYVTQNITKRPSFPKPVINKSQLMRRWDKAEVLKWLFSK